MCFEPLELFIRVQIRVLIVEPDDHTDVDEVGLHMVKESAGVCARIDWPADRMLDIARLEKSAAGIHLPDLFQTYPV